jgi:hypothetical protein
VVVFGMAGKYAARLRELHACCFSDSDSLSAALALSPYLYRRALRWLDMDACYHLASAPCLWSWTVVYWP